MLEFAIAIPVLLALIFGIIEFAWILNGHITLTGAVREGARIAVVSNHSSKDPEDIKDEAREAVIAHAATFQLEKGDIAVDLGPYKGETTVTVGEAKLPLLVGFFPLINNPYVIKDVKATMMQE